MSSDNDTTILMPDGLKIETNISTPDLIGNFVCEKAGMP